MVWATTCVLSVILLLIAVDLNFLYLFGKSPGFKDIKNPVTNEASEIYSADSVLIGRFFSENRTPVEYEDISPIIIQTLIDTEDERFYRHHGIDFQGLFAAVKDIASGRARGASTITQQLAKNLFRVRTQYSTGLLGKIPGVKILVMKAKEWIVAVKLERIFSKEEILTMYFNTVDFGSNSFGIKTACRTYFNTTPDQLTYEQAATLVGLLKATSSYNPKLNPKNSTKRRNVVLTNLYDGLLESDEYGKLVPAVAESWETEDNGITWTFHLRQGVKWVDQNGNEKGEVTAQDFLTGLEWVLNFHKNDATNTAMPMEMIEGAEDYYNMTSE